MGAAPLAVVMGDTDLLRPLVLAGIRCAIYAPPSEPVHWSRHVGPPVPWSSPWDSPGRAVEALLAYARSEVAMPVLLPQTDGDLLLVSRYRDRLRGAFRFLLADPELVEDLADKVRFSRLAERLGLPVPPARLLRPVDARPQDIGLRYPIVLKPATRWGAKWAPIEPAAKARHVESEAALARLWPKLVDLDIEVLAQEAVPGPEGRIESYHAYIDGSGTTVADFTGRKIRTRPAQYGHSTALEITQAHDVSSLGRDVLARVGLRGMAKVDFKRGPDGALLLLEINARSTLWHHPAACAGVNLPALLYADLTGLSRPPMAPARPGVRWCLPLEDARAAREAGASLRGWARWALGCEAISGLAWDDPLPFLGGRVLPVLRGRAARLVRTVTSNDGSRATGLAPTGRTGR